MKIRQFVQNLLEETDKRTHACGWPYSKPSCKPTAGFKWQVYEFLIPRRFAPKRLFQNVWPASGR